MLLLLKEKIIVENERKFLTRVHIQNEKFNFRHDRQLRHKVEDALTNGLGLGLDERQAVYVR